MKNVLVSVAIIASVSANVVGCAEDAPPAVRDVVRLAYSDLEVCLVNAQGKAACSSRAEPGWTTPDVPSDAPIVDIVFSPQTYQCDVEGTADARWVLDAKGDVYSSIDPEAAPYMKGVVSLAPNGPLPDCRMSNGDSMLSLDLYSSSDRIASLAGFGCGLGENGGAHCSGDVGSGLLSATEPAHLLEATVTRDGARVMCGAVGDERRLVCVGSSDEAIVANTPDVRGVTSLIVTDGYACASYGQDDAVCWGADSWINNAPKGVSFYGVRAQATTYVCGLTKDKQPICWGGGLPDALEPFRAE